MTISNHSFGLLAPHDLIPIIKRGLSEAGYHPSFAFDPSRETETDLPLIPLILVVLCEEMEKPLERFEDRLYAEGQQALFDEAEGRESWDQSRWASHLGPKLARLIPDQTDENSRHPSPDDGSDTEGSLSLVIEKQPVSQEKTPQTSSLSGMDLGSAEDLLADEESPLFHYDLDANAVETAPELTSHSVSGAPETPPTTSERSDKPAPAPTGWALEEPAGIGENEEKTPPELIATSHFNTEGLSFVDDQKEDASGTEQGSEQDPPAPIPPEAGDFIQDPMHRGFILILGGIGGPAPIKEILGHLGGHLPVPVVIHQPLPQGRYEALAANLSKLSPIPVLSAKNGAELQAGHAWVLEDGLIPELSQEGKWRAVSGDIALAISRVGDTQGALLAVSGVSPEVVFPAMEALAAGALLVGQDPSQAYESNTIDTLSDLGMITGSAQDLGAHLMEHWGNAPRPPEQI